MPRTRTEAQTSASPSAPAKSAGASTESSARPAENGRRTAFDVSRKSGRLHAGGPAVSVQPKLTVNDPGDRYEQEAERVDDAVMRMTGPEPATEPDEDAPADRIQRMCPRCRRRARQGKPLDCDECEQELQRKEDGSGRDEAPVQQAEEATRGSGQSLPDRTQSFFEERMGADFSDVQIHTGGEADQAARSINARAYTLGNDVVMRSGEYRPHSREGKRLLAHELTHVVQQTEDRSPSRELRRQNTEEKADQTKQGEGRCTFERSLPQGSVYRVYNFDVERSELKPGHEQCLRDLVLPAIRETENPVIGVVGHASTTGSRELNKNLSLQRAEAVYEWLESQDLADATLRGRTGVGEERPIDPSTPHNPGVERAEDRAVRIQIFSVNRMTEDPCKVKENKWGRMFERHHESCMYKQIGGVASGVMCGTLKPLHCVILWTAPEGTDLHKLAKKCCSTDFTTPEEKEEEIEECTVERVTEQIKSMPDGDCAEGQVRSEFEDWMERTKEELRKKKEKKEE